MHGMQTDAAVLLLLALTASILFRPTHNPTPNTRVAEVRLAQK
jgi:hypothetical protein